MLNKNIEAGNNFKCIPLDWDTNYFGVNSARVNLKGEIDDSAKNIILDFCREYEFITISNEGNYNENNNWIGTKTNAFLADINIKFTKTPNLHVVDAEKQTSVSNLYSKNEEILDIAKNAFQFSRFLNDYNLPFMKASNIYLHWTECAFDKPDKYFVVSEIDGKVAGYLLFSIHEKKLTSIMELMAVGKNYKGIGIGDSLIKAMDSFICKKGITQIQVGTQIDNIVAARFYSSQGFKYKGCSSIYHMWNNKNRRV